MKQMIELEIKKNDLGLFQADAVLTLPPLCVSRQKADRDDLEYELRNAFSQLVEEIVQKQIKDEF
tara:strand:+ start:161 stop:355 length:195 start_codon:yes stop_codon:yes gene_type:complete